MKACVTGFSVASRHTAALNVSAPASGAQVADPDRLRHTVSSPTGYWLCTSHPRRLNSAVSIHSREIFQLTTQQIRIRGARTHNLKNVSVDLPRDKLIVITGLSGSGKSSLAFDTLYAEGQRRYVES